MTQRAGPDPESSRGTGTTPRRSRPALVGLRVVLPGTILAVALVVGVIWSWSLALPIALFAMFVVVADLVIRLAFVSQEDRDGEANARRRFDRTGRWPGDDR